MYVINNNSTSSAKAETISINIKFIRNLIEN